MTGICGISYDKDAKIFRFVLFGDKIRSLKIAAAAIKTFEFFRLLLENPQKFILQLWNLAKLLRQKQPEIKIFHEFGGGNLCERQISAHRQASGLSVRGHKKQARQPESSDCHAQFFFACPLVLV